MFSFTNETVTDIWNSDVGMNTLREHTAEAMYTEQISFIYGISYLENNMVW